MSTTTFSVTGAASNPYLRSDGTYFDIIVGTPGGGVSITASPGAILNGIRNGSAPGTFTAYSIPASTVTSFWTLDSTGKLAVEYIGPSATSTPTASPTPSPTPTASPALSPTPSPTSTPSPTPTASPTASPTPSATASIIAGFGYFSPTTSTTNIPLVLSTTPPNGTFLIAGTLGAGYEVFAAPATGPTWTPAIATSNNTGSNTTTIWYRFYATGDPITYTFTGNIGDYLSGFIEPIAGVSATDPIACASSFSNTSANTATWPSIAPIVAGSIDVLTIVTNTGSDTFSVPTGFSTIHTFNPPYHAVNVFSYTNPPLSALTPTTSISASDTNALTQCIINPVGASPTPTPAPTSTPTASPTPSPTPTGSPGIDTAYSSLEGITPAGGTYPYYPTSPFHSALPASPNPVPSATNMRWNQDQIAGSSPGDEFGDIQISEDASSSSADPTYYTAGDGTSTPFVCALNSAGSVGKYYCDNTLSSFNNSIAEFWNNAGSCPDSAFGGTNYGCPVTINFNVPAGAIAAGDTDHHAVFIHTNETYNGVGPFEIDTWGDGSLSSEVAPTSGSWTWAAIGVCDLNGNGEGCNNSYATHMAGSLGLVRAEDILYCLTGAGASNSDCVLPYALALAPKCNGTLYVVPATASDGQCGGGGTTSNTGGDSTRLPEGSRGYLNETDSTINAMSIPDYQKVILRTLDKQHYGGFVRDTNYSGGPGIVFQYQGGEAYYSMSHTDPWQTLYSYEVSEGNSSYITVGNSGKNLLFTMSMTAAAMNWCSNAGCT